MENRFEIDFFEFAFLVEACIPPRPIARSMFWDKVIDEYYDILTFDERIRLFGWIQNNPCYNLENDDCKLFHLRYDPDNQYNVTTNFDGKVKTNKCFKVGERYHTKKFTSIDEDCIIKIEKINYEE